MASSSSLPISLQHDSSSSSDVSGLHLLPFHLSYSGKADVAAYFSDSQPYFRGRMMVGTPIDVPAGYTGQIWRSNGPSMAAPSTQAQSQSRKREREDNAESPRRSPRKHAAQPQKPVPKKQKKKPVKRQVFAMSPDASPVKQEEALSNSYHHEGEVLDQDMLDQKLEQAAVSLVKEEEKHLTDNEQNDAVKEENIITLQEQAKDAPADETKRVERAATPPPPPSSALTLPTTPIQASSLPPSSLPHTPLQQDILRDSGPLVEKKLMPIATFNKFTIWNPDNALDKGSDEYVRSLNEWIGLAELVSSSSDR